jgi:DNA polymerase (family 10)
VRRGEAQRLRGIGPSIEQRLVELVQTGRLSEIEELEDRVQPALVGLGRYLGVNPRQTALIGRTLRVNNLDDLRAAAAAGRLQEVPGIGPAKERRIVAALAQEARPEVAGRTPAHQPRKAVMERIADEVRGEVAGDVRRWRDQPRELAIVTFAPHPEPVVDTFCSLHEIVTVIERGERRAVGVTVDGMPVELVVAEPGSYGTELLRATGSRAYVEGLGPLPDAVDEEGVVRGARRAVVPAGAARGAVPRRAAAAGVRRGHPRRPAHAHDLVGREVERAGDGRGRRSSAATSTWRSAITRAR